MSRLDYEEATILFEVATKTRNPEAWREAKAAVSQRLGRNRNRKSILQSYRLAVQLVLSDERGEELHTLSRANPGDSLMGKILAEVEYGLTPTRVGLMAEWFLSWKYSRMTATGDIAQRIQDKLWWPSWEEVPLDMYRGTVRRKFVQGREFRWGLESDGFVKQAKVPDPSAGFSDEELVTLFGEQSTEAIRNRCTVWVSLMAEYLSRTRGLRQEVLWSGEYDSGSSSAKEVRNLEDGLHAIREEIMAILAGRVTG